MSKKQDREYYRLLSSLRFFNGFFFGLSIFSFISCIYFIGPFLKGFLVGLLIFSICIFLVLIINYMIAKINLSLENNLAIKSLIDEIKSSKM